MIAAMTLKNIEDQTPKPAETMIERLFARPAAGQDTILADLRQQLQVNGTKALIVLCGRTSTGTFEALRIYQNERLATADCELSERITNENFWLSSVALFPSYSTNGDRTDDDKSKPIHVLCLKKPDGSIEALRAFENANQASADLEFFGNISNAQMWVSVILHKNLPVNR
jgi:hypothetical protein